MTTLDDIRRLTALEAFQWTNHAMLRLIQRRISMDEIAEALQGCIILEQYPTDFPYPSCLVSGETGDNKTLHIVCASDGSQLWIITAYWPDTEKWSDDLRERKE